MRENAGWQSLVESLHPGARKPEELVRAQLREKPRLFLTFAAFYLSGNPTAEPSVLLARILAEVEFLSQVCQDEPEIVSFPVARRLIDGLRRHVPNIDRILSQCLSESLNRPHSEQDRATLLRGLTMLSGIADGSRLLTLQIQYMRSHDPFVRSKAAALIGGALRNSGWFEKLLGDPDARTRANAIEALWGSDWPVAPSLFERALRDPHHRVVANAIIGLFLSGSRDQAASHLSQMAADPRPQFQAAADFATRYLRERGGLPAPEDADTDEDDVTEEIEKEPEPEQPVQAL